jgi:hypothetical protein
MRARGLQQERQEFRRFFIGREFLLFSAVAWWLHSFSRAADPDQPTNRWSEDTRSGGSFVLRTRISPDLFALL